MNIIILFFPVISMQTCKQTCSKQAASMQQSFSKHAASMQQACSNHASTHTVCKQACSMQASMQHAAGMLSVTGLTLRDSGGPTYWIVPGNHGTESTGKSRKRASFWEPGFYKQIPVPSVLSGQNASPLNMYFLLKARLLKAGYTICYLVVQEHATYNIHLFSGFFGP